MDKFAGYTLTKRIHVGRGTVLYEGLCDEDRQPVVIKLSSEEHRSASGYAKIEHEYALLQALDIRGIPTARAIERFENGVALVLDRIPAPPLSQLLASSRLDLRASLQIAVQVARILGDLHRARVFHKDIKPHNILVDRETYEVHLIDFGITTRIASEVQTFIRPEAPDGTLAYMSPEQTGRMNRGLDYRTDFYSLGVTLYQCLAGTRPFTSDDPLELIHSHIARMPPALGDEVPPVVAQLVMKLLAKAAEDRYQSAAGLVADLERCLSSLSEHGEIESFALGSHDHTGALQISQRLFGRATELGELHDAFSRVRDGASELILVTGYAGVGKSALVNEIYKPIAADHGLFVAGKFDQFNRTTPYASIGAAFGELIQVILSERASRLDDWRQRLQDALGANGQVLTALIPALELVVGPQLPVPELGSTESQNRFNLVFKRFIDVLAQPEHPFALFLDDLQWADPASLALLEALLLDRARGHFLLIGAYRDSEVDRAHPLSLVLDSLREGGVEPRILQLEPLSAADVGELVSETLQSKADACEPLARVVHAKTLGNPFFANQFLREIYADGALRYDADATTRWVYDLEAINRHAYTDNVVDFMAAKILRLPNSVREILTIAACIGHRFDFHTLITITGRSAREISESLWAALDLGLIVPLDANYHLMHVLTDSPAVNLRYRFLHDRVQQAAYDLTDQDRRMELHLKIGRPLLADRVAGDSDDRLFEIVNHLNHGAPLLTDQAERTELARLNLEAGRRAKLATAYDAATGYLRGGTNSLPASAWATDYSLCFELHRELAECEYLCGRFSVAEELFQALIEHAQDQLDEAEIYTIRLRLYQVAGRYNDGVDLAHAALAKLGVTFPEDAEGVGAATGAEAARVPENLGERSVASLIDAPRMSDPRHERIMGLLAGLLPCAYIGRPEVFPLAALRMVNFSLQHGNTEASCFAYSAYGLMSVAAFGEIPRGLEFSELSIALNERFGDTSLRGCLLHLHGDHINFWRHHIRTDFPILERAFHACLEVGDHVYAGYLAFETPWQAIEAGDTPTKVRALTERYKAFATQTKNHAVFETIRMQEQYLTFLEGHTEEASAPTTEVFDKRASLARVTEASFGCGIAFFHIIELITLYTKGRHEAALAAASEARPVLGAVMAMPIEATFYLYEALALLASPDATTDSVELHLQKFALWAQHCPANFEHKYLLLQAEVARVDNSPAAAGLYDEALESARTNGFIQYEALGNELAGRYYHALGRRRIAPVYLNAAYVCYVRWGATGVAAALRDRFREHVSTLTDSDNPNQHAQIATATHTTSTTGTQRVIDLSTVLRATEALAGEVDVEALIGKIMQLVLHNAGGVHASLFIVRGDDLVLGARGAVQPDELQIGADTPLDDCRDVATSIVRLVARTRTGVVLADAQDDPRCAQDLHVARAEVRSILCVPLVHRQILVGVLYVENPRVKGAFSIARVALLETLSTQAAGAMENARLYADLSRVGAELSHANERLEAKVQARTDELREANERLLHQLEQREESERARTALQDQVIDMQRKRLLELSSPLIPITDHIRVLPLVGVVDDERARHVLESVLEDSRVHSTRTLLIDLTGVRNVNTEIVARVLVTTARTLRLLGTETVLTGIHPALARTLIDLDLSIGDLATRATLQDGISFAMHRSGAPRTGR
ncbi:AAA family ATPase [Enhygromyxa salina]|uniref:RsbT co-antagonist protein RsbRA n=1 Tax=Enhygromyxa salina TaxID=215803 RepID=A0A2S9YTE3_9BACT|nr:AAA family ATPase [Enhygromyxa salina]PRQ08381.1 RsbT co-antagonist protein RsbRA [Enhygromyxa salina]